MADGLLFPPSGIAHEVFSNPEGLVVVWGSVLSLGVSSHIPTNSALRKAWLDRDD